MRIDDIQVAPIADDVGRRCRQGVRVTRADHMRSPEVNSHVAYSRIDCRIRRRRVHDGYGLPPGVGAAPATRLAGLATANLVARPIKCDHLHEKSTPVAKRKVI